MPRQTIAATAAAFIAGRTAHCHNARTDGQTYLLHGHAIAWKESSSIVATYAGWPSPTTQRHLTAIARAAGRADHILAPTDPADTFILSVTQDQ
jgi:hypothetical protein